MPDRLTYILPIRSRRLVSSELIDYLQTTAASGAVDEIVVVDGSAMEIFEDFAARCDPTVRHIPPDADLTQLANGKVAGVLTGLRHASHARLVLADEDVRHDASTLTAMNRALDRADVVRPQNYFDPMPWHACLDTARTLINRVTGGDWPGTLGVRRESLLRVGGYDGDVLFENLELVRTICAAGGVSRCPLNLFVRRLPADTSHFWSQRVRQAYDEWARPLRLLCWLSILPVMSLLVAHTGPWALVVAAMVAIGVAELGRRIGQGVTVFPVCASVAAPMWVLERAICAWLAVGARLIFGGVWYAGRRISRAATPSWRLVRRFGFPGPLEETSGRYSK